MATYTYSAHAKQALRKAITSHPQWPSYSAVTQISSANLSIDAMESIAAIFENPKIDLTEYGTLGRQRRGWANKPPVEKTVPPATVAMLKEQLSNWGQYAKPHRNGFAHGVLETIETKQSGWASEAQAKVLRDVIAEGKAAAIAEPSTAEPINSGNSAISSNPEPSAKAMPDEPIDLAQFQALLDKYQNCKTLSMGIAWRQLDAFVSDVISNGCLRHSLFPRKEAQQELYKLGNELIQQAQKAGLDEPKPQPIPQPHSTLPANDAALLAMLKQLLGAQQAHAAPLDESRIIELIKQHAGQPATMRIDLTGAAQLPQLGEQLAHHKLPLLVSAIQAGVNVMLVGEAGSGKTKATEQAAQLLGRQYAFSGAVDSPYKLTGFIDAQGRLSRTALREAVEHGWVFCMDEIDGCLPGAVLPLNALASNRMADFPDGILKAHPDFALVACANTYGRGADRLYVGRNAQDAAVLDRWATISWDIDPTVEAGMLGLPAPHNAPKPVQLAPITDARALEAIAVDWLNLVRKTRSAVQKHKLRHVVSPRASQMGVKLLAAGWPWDEVTEACLYKGLDADSRAKIAA